MTRNGQSADGTARLEQRVLQDAMETLDSIRDNEVNVEVTLNADLKARCPMDESIENEYDLTVTYGPKNHVIETESFRDFLTLFHDEAVTQEALTTFIHRVLYTQFRPEWITVRVTGDHDEIAVTTEKTKGEP